MVHKMNDTLVRGMTPKLIIRKSIYLIILISRCSIRSEPNIKLFQIQFIGTEGIETIKYIFSFNTALVAYRVESGNKSTAALLFANQTMLCVFSIIKKHNTIITGQTGHIIYRACPTT